MLAMRPERLGHVCCLDDYEWEVLLASDIPVSSRTSHECLHLGNVGLLNNSGLTFNLEWQQAAVQYSYY